MHATTAAIPSKQTQMSTAFNRAKTMRDSHGDKSFSIRDVIVGMLKKAPDNRTITLSPNLAARLNDEARFPDQRKITPDRLYEAKQSILSGYWNPNHVIHVVRLSDGAFWVVNGQTRLTAIAECGKSIPVSIIVQPVEDEHEARAVYAQFDRGASTRTTQQLLSASAVAVEFNIPPQYANYLFSAVGIINNGLKVPSGSSTDERAVESRNITNKLGWIGEWAKEAHLYMDDVNACFPRGNPKKRRAMYRSGTLAVALMTYRYQRDRAHQFWQRVCDQENLRKYDPRNTLSRDIESRDGRYGVGFQSIQQAALAWNAFLQDRDLKIIKIISDWRLHLEGTPIRATK